mmetsp:Transcript_15074/g.34144  ORF Transcript_15074/g.34144 Transcript_15074/m.34144 type:complete len:106 (+) Transcript_15074:35-352(+)
MDRQHQPEMIHPVLCATPAEGWLEEAPTWEACATFYTSFNSFNYHLQQMEEPAHDDDGADIDPVFLGALDEWEETIDLNEVASSEASSVADNGNMEWSLHMDLNE